MTIYELRQSVEEDRPDGFSQRESSSADFWANHEIIRGRSRDLSKWSPMDLYCYGPGTSPPTDWDYYSHSSTSGLLSQRAVDVLSNYWTTCFDAMPSIFEGEPYYFLHCRNPIDCLDLAASQIVYFRPEEKAQIMDVEKYVFNKAVLCDPKIFTVPQLPLSIFTTESIPKIVEAAGLKGIRFLKLDGD